MRIVTLEEHFVIPSLVKKYGLDDKHLQGIKPDVRERLSEVGDRRLQSMDDSEISLQVLSAAAPGADALDGTAANDFARATNDALNMSVQKYPDRFAGFAHLPMRDPVAAAAELERAVTKLGFRGALINGMTRGLFLDDPQFKPLLTMAENLDVPLYLHPAKPPETVRQVYYDKLPHNYGLMLSMAGFGWHAEVAIHILRLAVSGTFERHPHLKVIVGHMGEALPFMLERANDVFTAQTPPVSVKDLILKHVWITTSGFFTMPPFLNSLQVFGADRILYSVDYPFAKNERGLKFLKSLALSPDDLQKVSHANADRLLKLT